MKSHRAKVLFEVGGEPMINWSIRRAISVGASPIVVVVGHESEAVKNEVTRTFGSEIQFAHQTERLGTGHAAKVGVSQIPHFEGHILILSGDVPLLEENSLRDLISELNRDTQTIAFMSTQLDNPTGYGRVVRDKASNVVRIVEHKDANRTELAINEVNAGVYVARSTFLHRALEKLSNDNAQKEYYLTDIVSLAIQDNLDVGGVIVDAEEVQGANNRAQLAELEATARRRIIYGHLMAGVTFLAPEQTYVGPEVVIGRDCVIHAGVHLRGQTELGPEVVVDAGAIITDSQIAEGSQIQAYSVLESAIVGPNCQIGPFARLRPDTTLKSQVRVGNFVEIKKSTLESGAKANHLTYLGDTSVGEDSNIGAGTITCNYDGTGKYKTQIGSKVFVGSNSTLIAPVSIGDQSYIGAGSVVNRNVPPESLTLGRSRQVDKLGRANTVRAQAAARKQAASANSTPSK